MKKVLLLFFIHFSIWAQKGVLFIAHGSIKEKSRLQNQLSPWEQNVFDEVKKLDKDSSVPIELAFGMWNTQCFDEGINRLEERLSIEGKELDELHIFPLFISGYSLVIEMQKFIFGLRKDQPFEAPHIKMGRYLGDLVYHSALDYDPSISLILAKRTQTLISLAKTNLKNLNLVLVMHGPVLDEDNIHWIEMGKSYLEDLNFLFPFHKTKVISLRDDAEEDIKNKASKELRNFILDSENKGKTSLVLPLLLSPKGIEQGIKKRLEGLKYIWKGDMLLPSQYFSKILKNKLKEIN